jgi:distribution and morphology protein 10
VVLPYLRFENLAVSTGLRFSTIPDATPPSFLNLKDSEQGSFPRSLHSSPALGGGPPTTMTAIYTPLIGHLQAAYATRVSPDLTMATRFDFNMYSFESKWTMGFEWWHKRPRSFASASEVLDDSPRASELQGVVKASVSTETVILSASA